MMKNKVIPILLLIIISLLSPIWTGWIRVGWDFPIANMAAQHGALMVNCFLASLIFLERAVAFRSKWVLLLPFINVLSIVAFIFDLPIVGQFLFIGGSSGFVTMCIYFIWRYREAYYYIFLLGAICLLAGNIILYRTNFYPSSVTWWIAFLLSSIVAERLELSRFLLLTNFKRLLLWASLLLVMLGLFWPSQSQGNIFLAAGTGVTAIWLLKYDMARHSIKVRGQHRYSGALLIVGYVWLLVMSVLLPIQNILAFGNDAVLHSFFIGFVFSMIFSHAVIILPAIIKIPVKLFRPVLYVGFGMLQVSLTVRVVADLLEDPFCRKIGGLFNGLSIIFFFLSVAFILKSELKKAGQAKTTVTSAGGFRRLKSQL